MAAVRNLAIYMVGMGQNAYILPVEFYPRPDPRYQVRIYSKDELESIFRCADKKKPAKSSPFIHLIIPVIFRLLYCCGLRPCEALNLRMENINLNSGEIRIVQSKGLKDRLVVMSEDMAVLCGNYNENINALYPDREYFFQNVQTNSTYGKTWISKHFKALLNQAGIDRSSMPKPRLYDLRHTFATHCLQRWIEQDKDVNAKLLYLSAYMGHKDVTNTAYYIHLLPTEFREQSKVSSRWYSELAEVAD
jgi:integrase